MCLTHAIKYHIWSNWLLGQIQNCLGCGGVDGNVLVMSSTSRMSKVVATHTEIHRYIEGAVLINTLRSMQNGRYLQNTSSNRISCVQLLNFELNIIFPWLCVWDGCTIIFCHLLHIYPGSTGTLFLLLMFSLWYLQMIEYIMACRSCSFVCRLHHLIIIIMQTYLKALNY